MCLPTSRSTFEINEQVKDSACRATAINAPHFEIPIISIKLLHNTMVHHKIRSNQTNMWRKHLERVLRVWAIMPIVVYNYKPLMKITTPRKVCPENKGKAKKYFPIFLSKWQNNWNLYVLYCSPHREKTQTIEKNIHSKWKLFFFFLLTILSWIFHCVNFALTIINPTKEDLSNLVSRLNVMNFRKLSY